MTFITFFYKFYSSRMRRNRKGDRPCTHPVFLRGIYFFREIQKHFLGLRHLVVLLLHIRDAAFVIDILNKYIYVNLIIIYL